MKTERILAQILGLESLSFALSSFYRQFYWTYIPMNFTPVPPDMDRMYRWSSYTVLFSHSDCMITNISRKNQT